MENDIYIVDIISNRIKIDEIDRQIIELFNERMATVKNIAHEKKTKKIDIANPGREIEVINNVTKYAHPEIKEYALMLYKTMLEVSRSYQKTL